MLSGTCADDACVPSDFRLYVSPFFTESVARERGVLSSIVDTNQDPEFPKSLHGSNLALGTGCA